MMFERIETCPICDNQQFENAFICQDHQVTKESFALMHCTNCNLLLTNPRPAKSDIDKYYQSDQYISHADKGNSLINILYKVARNYTLKNKIKLLRSFNQSKDVGLLDFGCGTGYFLKAAMDIGWRVTGVEPDPESRQKSIEKIGSTHVFGSIDELPESLSFDFITLWHVLEHIHDLNETLQVLHNSLNKKGNIVIAVPNHESYDAALYKEFWAGFDVPRHLYHFSVKTMTSLLKRNNFKLIKIIPQKLDAYYVSLLSEKYIKGDSSLRNMVKSFINGWKSNSYARKNQQKYSSLIFVARK